MRSEILIVHRITEEGGMIAPGVGRVSEECAYVVLKAAAQRAKREALMRESASVVQEVRDWIVVRAVDGGLSIIEQD